MGEAPPKGNKKIADTRPESAINEIHSVRMEGIAVRELLQHTSVYNLRAGG
jgi:hypothetical protein